MINNTDQTLSFNLPKNSAWLLWGCQLVNISSLAAELSTWMLAILALCLCWQALLLSRQKASNVSPNVGSAIKLDAVRMSPFILMLLAISGCIAIAVSARSFGVLIAMVHLLTFAYALKAFEIKKRKDFYQHSLLGVFLLACALIFKQDLGFSLFILLLLVINLTLIHQAFAKRNSLFNASKTVVILLLQSSLLAITLFVVFPRLSPFWQVPMANSAKTGLSDVVSPGDIANLALSSELAFRANFKGESIPAYSTLYWRAMTLENYDGRKWTRANNNEQGQHNTKAKQQGFNPTTSGTAISYQVIAQPSFQPWLFALSVATTTDPKLVLKQDYTIQSTTIVNQLKHYQIKSYPDAPLALSLSQQSRQRNLAIKPGSNPKLEQLAVDLKAKHPNSLALSQAILATFREQKYYYTLQAPMLINNSLDQFYFDTKAGFCVHYASSFTYLMRAAGVPARVVTGYLGGEYNDESNDASSEDNSSQGGHLSIYQYDAHAWSEIWLEGTGWYRVDPTAAVDPERVSKGWSSALLAQQSELNSDFISLYRIKQLAWLNTLRLKLDAINYQWTRWVLGYSAKQQYDILKRWFGQSMPWKTAAIIAMALMLAMALFTLFYWLSGAKNSKHKVSPAQAVYNQCLTALAKKGFTKERHQTTQQFSLVIHEQLPHLSADFTELTSVFECLHYQQYSEQEQLALMAQLAKKVRDVTKALKSVSAMSHDMKKVSSITNNKKYKNPQQ